VYLRLLVINPRSNCWTVWNVDKKKAKALADALTCGQWTHDYPITLEHAKELGLPVSSPLPEDVYALMDLYPQPGGQRPSVEYVPMPYRQRGK